MSGPSPSARYVPDANVAVKLFVVEDQSVEARAFFALLETDPGVAFYVPELFYTEVANVLWKYVRRDKNASDRGRVELEAAQETRRRAGGNR